MPPVPNLAWMANLPTIVPVKSWGPPGLAVSWPFGSLIREAEHPMTDTHCRRVDQEGSLLSRQTYSLLCVSVAILRLVSHTSNNREEERGQLLPQSAARWPAPQTPWAPRPLTHNGANSPRVPGVPQA